MSGGAGGSSGGAGDLLLHVAQLRSGRVFLWFATAFLVLSSFNLREHDSLYLLVAAILAFFALIGHFMSARRKRAARASRRSGLIFLAFVLVVLVSSLFLVLWLVFRRKKDAVTEEPPTQSEIDTLIDEANA